MRVAVSVIEPKADSRALAAGIDHEDLCAAIIPADLDQWNVERRPGAFPAPGPPTIEGGDTGRAGWLVVEPQQFQRRRIQAGHNQAIV